MTSDEWNLYLKPKIRLKEYQANRTTQDYPFKSIRQLSDETVSSEPFLIRTHNFGIIITENKVQDNPIPGLFIGGSTVESSLIPEEEGLVSPLGRIRIRNGHRLNVSHTGYSGITAPHKLDLIRNKIPNIVLPANLVVNCVGPSDESAISEGGSYWSSSKSITPLAPSDTLVEPVRQDPENLRPLFSLMYQSQNVFGYPRAVIAGPFRDGYFSWYTSLRGRYHRDRIRFNQANIRRINIIETSGNLAESFEIPYLNLQNFLRSKTATLMTSCISRIAANGIVQKLPRNGYPQKLKRIR